ncbi:MAG: Mut7-C RNAse domain-containing protein [Pseudomonadota bacterium]|nr:Mut7-C RNAse domain-containing protein [Pseudomonadota bacterium]
MAIAWFRFYEELNDFLTPGRRKVAFRHIFDRRASVKDMIESFGVPHTEVDLILVNGESAGFNRIVRDHDRVSVYPVFESLDVSPLLRLRERPLRRTRFVVDCNLGRLARYLRLLGFDTRYENDFRDEAVARISGEEGRVLLTRDRRLLQRRIVTHGMFIRETDPRRQVTEVLRRLDLGRDISPFTRCSRCNGRLEVVDKSEVLERLEPKTRRYYHVFRRCTDCGQIYWKGSHHDRAQRLVAEFLETEGGDSDVGRKAHPRPR